MVDFYDMIRRRHDLGAELQRRVLDRSCSCAKLPLSSKDFLGDNGTTLRSPRAECSEPPVIVIALLHPPTHSLSPDAKSAPYNFMPPRGHRRLVKRCLAADASAAPRSHHQRGCGAPPEHVRTRTAERAAALKCTDALARKRTQHVSTRRRRVSRRLVGKTSSASRNCPVTAQHSVLAQPGRA